MWEFGEVREFGSLGQGEVSEVSVASGGGKMKQDSIN